MGDGLKPILQLVKVIFSLCLTVAIDANGRTAIGTGLAGLAPAPMTLTAGALCSSWHLPQAANIRIVNPATTGATLSYMLNGQQFGLQPGSMEEVRTVSVIQFDRWVTEALLKLRQGKPARVRPQDGSMRGRIEGGQLVTLESSH